MLLILPGHFLLLLCFGLDQHEEWVAVLQAGHSHIVASLRKQMADDLDAAMQVHSFINPHFCDGYFFLLLFCVFNNVSYFIVRYLWILVKPCQYVCQTKKDAAAATEARCATAVAEALQAEAEKQAAKEAEAVAMMSIKAGLSSPQEDEEVSPQLDTINTAVSASGTSPQVGGSSSDDSDTLRPVGGAASEDTPAVPKKKKKAPLLILALKCAILEVLRYEDPRSRPDKTAWAIRNQSLKTISSLLHFDQEVSYIHSLFLCIMMDYTYA